jgi:hypothetical protein
MLQLAWKLDSFRFKSFRVQGMAPKLAERGVEQCYDGLRYKTFVTFVQVIFVEFEIRESVLKKFYSPE